MRGLVTDWENRFIVRTCKEGKKKKKKSQQATMMTTSNDLRVGATKNEEEPSFFDSLQNSTEYVYFG
jgi:hypothetical protein